MVFRGEREKNWMEVGMRGWLEKLRLANLSFTVGADHGNTKKEGGFQKYLLQKLCRAPITYVNFFSRPAGPSQTPLM